MVFPNIGIFGIGAGPSVHVVDPEALTDPLLARIPYDYNPGWRPGHFQRPIPAGYVISVLGINRIRDKCIASYYDKLHRIVSGPLFTAERWKAIVELNMPSGMTVRPCPAPPRS